MSNICSQYKVAERGKREKRVFYHFPHEKYPHKQRSVEKTQFQITCRKHQQKENIRKNNIIERHTQDKKTTQQRLYRKKKKKGREEVSLPKTPPLKQLEKEKKR